MLSADTVLQRKHHLHNSGRVREQSEMMCTKLGMLITNPICPLISYLIPNEVLTEVLLRPREGTRSLGGHLYWWTVGDDYAHLSAIQETSGVKSPTIEFPIKDWERVLQYWKATHLVNLG